MTRFTHYKIIFIALLILGINSALALPAKAEEPKGEVKVKEEKVVIPASDTMDMPAAQSSSEGKEERSDDISAAYPTMRLTQDKSEMVKLDQEAASIIVGNPNHISVLLDTPDTIVVVPRAAGASHFTVMGKDGSIIMQRHVIVGAPKEKYVRIRRSCNAGSKNCKEMSTYYCPDTCHEVKANGEKSKGGGFSFF